MVDADGARPVIQSWQRGLWLWVSASLGVMGAMLCIFVGYMVTKMSTMISVHGNDLSFVFSGMTLLILTLLRLLAILVGAGMVFGGLAVSFYTHEKATQLAADAPGLAKGSLGTSSPGIAAIVVGAVVILSALFAKGEYRYDPPIYQIMSSVPKLPGAEPGASAGARASSSATPASASGPLKSSDEVFQELRKSKQ